MFICVMHEPANPKEIKTQNRTLDIRVPKKLTTSTEKKNINSLEYNKDDTLNLSNSHTTATEQRHTVFHQNPNLRV